MSLLIDVDAEELGAVVMAAACWVMGLPLDRTDETKVRFLARQIEAVAAEVTNEDTGQPLGFVDGWWRPDAPDNGRRPAGLDANDKSSEGSDNA